MSPATGVIIASIIAGIFQLAAGMVYVRHIVRTAPRQARLWATLAGLILGFIIGYAAFAIAVRSMEASFLTAVAAAVFCFGGTFVLLVTRLSAFTIDDVVRVSVLERENERISSMRRRLQTILDNTAEAIIIFDGRGVIEGFNRQAEVIFGQREHDALGRHVCSFMSPDGESFGSGDAALDPNCVEQMLGGEREVFGRDHDGRVFPASIKLSVSEIDKAPLFTALISDISARKETLNQLQHLAERDALTGLYNRRYFMRVLQAAYAGASTSQPCWLLYIDLDHFKQVNDELGHAAGDRLLCDIAAALTSGVRQSDVVARLGGDEIVVLLKHVPEQQVSRIADVLRQRLSRCVSAEANAGIGVGCSIGVARLGSGNNTAEEALSQADAACRNAKRQGRSRVCLCLAADGAVETYNAGDPPASLPASS